VLDQATLCDFITAGHMDQHMRRMRELYESRLDTLARAVQQDLDGVLQLKPGQGGLQVVGWLGDGIDEIEACDAAAAQGINSVPLSKLTVDRKLPPALVLGVASADEGAIRQAVARLGHVLRALQHKDRTRP